MAVTDVKKISYSIQEAAAATGLSVSFLDAAIRSGGLRARQTKQDPKTGKTLGKRVVRAGRPRGLHRRSPGRGRVMTGDVTRHPSGQCGVGRGASLPPNHPGPHEARGDNGRLIDSWIVLTEDERAAVAS